eukprot:2488879-Pyramimonas_sp.AAC.1
MKIWRNAINAALGAGPTKGYDVSPALHLKRRRNACSSVGHTHVCYLVMGSCSGGGASHLWYQRSA